MLKTLDQASNRTVFAIVLASLVIGSALMVLSGVPPKWHEIPIIGIIGFLGAGIMAFWLLFSILRHGKLQFFLLYITYNFYLFRTQIYADLRRKLFHQIIKCPTFYFRFSAEIKLKILIICGHLRPK